MRTGERVRVTAQLVDPRTEEHLWAERYERDLRNVLSMQNEIASSIAREIELQLTPQEQVQLARARPVNPEAYEDYLKGRHHMGSLAANAVPTATQYFNQAIEKDPSFALAYAGLSVAYAYTFTPAGVQRSKAAALKALELDDSLAEAHASLGLIRHRIDWDWLGAEVHFRRAIELNPGSSVAHNTYAIYLLHMKRLEEALRECTRARELDPLSAENRGTRAAVFYVMREYDRAWEEYQGMLDLFPNLPGPHGGFAHIHLQKGRYEEAVAEARKVEELSEGDRNYLWTVWYIYGRAGKRDEALRVLNELRERSKRERVDASAFAIVYSGLGEKDQAFAWLEKAYQQREWPFPALQVTPVFDPLRDDPRFQELLRRMNFPEN
jgi:tetratricopeptide (TPR) repeat protein